MLQVTTIRLILNVGNKTNSAKNAENLSLRTAQHCVLSATQATETGIALRFQIHKEYVTINATPESET